MLAHALGLECDTFSALDRNVPAVADVDTAPITLPGDGRLVRSHEICRPEYSRVIYVVRDPRHVAVSYLRYRRWLGEFTGTDSEFADMFVKGSVDGYGTWDVHVASYLAVGTRVILVRYEDLRQNTGAELRRVCDFIGIAPPTRLLSAAVEENDVARMQAKERAGGEFAGRTAGRFVATSAPLSGWSDATTAKIEARFSKVMARLGYPA